MITQDLMNKVTDNVINKMETCGSGWLRSWVGESQLPVNCETGKAYQGINLFILLGQEKSSGKWGTYKAWSRLDKQISKGEKGTQIIYFKIEKSKTKVDKKGEPLKYPMMRIYTVFNESQIDGYEMEIKTEGETFSHADADLWVQNSGAVIDYNNISAFYNPNTDKIGMPPMESFFKTDDATAEQNFYGTLFHELTHWTGHTSRNDRLKARASRNDYAYEELIAELGACFQSVHFGIEPAEVNADHTKYLNGWLKALKDDKQLIFKASAEANKSIQFLESLQKEDTKKVA
jgi:antirestriction protein ArdC